MRTLFGALIGVLLGGALIAVLTSSFDVQKAWPILLAGLVAGIAMRAFASDHHVSYLRGGLAALATVLAMICGPFVGAKMISQKAPSVAKVVASTTDAVEEAVSTGEGDLEEAVGPPMPLAGPGQSKGVIGAPKGDMDPMEALFMAAGCLIAYQVGKGSEAASEETEATSDAESSDGATHVEGEPNSGTVTSSEEVRDET